MEKQSKTQEISKKSWLTVGILLMVVLIGASGCGQSQATTAPSTATTTAPSTSQGQAAAKGQRVSNPALQAAMEIRRLENDQQNPLTSDQKDKLKPILQALISTSNPSQDILQQKADAINAIFTDQQKSTLTQARPSKGNKQNANSSTENSTQGTSTQAGDGTGAKAAAGTGSKQPRSAVTPQTMYQQVLDSLK
ncbi:MAG: hypothetical protein P4L49_21205 [Desulfosporosinus sp.]|nr:hypothetical protein [Desulfosporosinus sp.]